MDNRKKIVYHTPISDELFSLIQVLENLRFDKEELIQRWGEENYNKLLSLIEESVLRNNVQKKN